MFRQFRYAMLLLPDSFRRYFAAITMLMPRCQLPLLLFHTPYVCRRRIPPRADIYATCAVYMFIAYCAGRCRRCHAEMPATLIARYHVATFSMLTSLMPPLRYAATPLPAPYADIAAMLRFCYALPRPTVYRRYDAAMLALIRYAADDADYFSRTPCAMLLLAATRRLPLMLFSPLMLCRRCC